MSERKGDGCMCGRVSEKAIVANDWKGDYEWKGDEKSDKEH